MPARNSRPRESQRRILSVREDNLRRDEELVIKLGENDDESLKWRSIGARKLIGH